MNATKMILAITVIAIIATVVLFAPQEDLSIASDPLSSSKETRSASPLTSSQVVESEMEKWALQEARKMDREAEARASSQEMPQSPRVTEEPSQTQQVSLEPLPDLQVIARSCDNPMKILPTLERTCSYEVRNNAHQEIVWEPELKVCFRPIGEYWERCSTQDRDIDILTYDITTDQGHRTNVLQDEKLRLQPGEAGIIEIRFVVPSDARIIKQIERHMGAGASVTNIEGEFTFGAKEVRPTYRAPYWSPPEELVLSQYTTVDRDECHDTELDQTDRSIKCLFYVENISDKDQRYEFHVEVCYWLLGGERHCTERFDGEIRLGINPHLVQKDERGMRDEYEVQVTSSREVENEVGLVLAPGETHSFVVHVTDLHDTRSFKEASKNLTEEKQIQLSSQTAIPSLKGELQILLRPR